MRKTDSAGSFDPGGRRKNTNSKPEAIKMASGDVGVPAVEEEVPLMAGGDLVVAMEKKTRRRLRASEHLAVKHALPKTRLYHTILHENTSQERHLSMKLTRIQRRKGQFASNLELSRRTFINRQTKKHHKWRQEDEVRSGNMNFPTIRAEAIRGSSKFRPTTVDHQNSDKEENSSDVSFKVIYRSPRYFDVDADKATDGSILPFMKICRPSTEFVEHKKKTYMTRLPSFVEVDDQKLRRYNTYCGEELLKPNSFTEDARFAALTHALSARKSASSSRGDEEAKKRDCKTAMDAMRRERDGEDNDGPRSAGAALGRKNENNAKMRVVFPSLSSSPDSLCAPSPHRKPPQQRERRHKDTSKSDKKKHKIREDLKNKDLNNLVQSYGTIQGGYGKPEKTRQLDGDESDTKTPVGAETSSGGKDRTFKSPSLQLMFTVKSKIT